MASLARHVGGVPVDPVPPANTDSTVAAGMSYGEQCQDCGGSPKIVGLSHAVEDTSFVELEAIVVGAVGMRAPWFLTGWVEGTEVEFMIDTVCQVAILATSVFKRMCAADLQIQDRLRWLVSADSSPLMVCGELCMTVVFLSLQCDMMLVIASIGSE